MTMRRAGVREESKPMKIMTSNQPIMDTLPRHGTHSHPSEPGNGVTLHPSQAPAAGWHPSCSNQPRAMMQIIHQFCNSARCQPADIVLEWDSKTGARLTAKDPDGTKNTLNVLCSLNHMAQALLLATAGEEKRYPQLLEQQKQLDAKIRQWQARGGDTTESDANAFDSTSHDEVSTKDWRGAKTPAEVLQWFPARPKPDELIDLWQLNKKFASPQLANLLKKHSR
jgi:hypothetical protein